MSTSSVANLISLSVPSTFKRNAAASSKSPSSIRFRPVGAGENNSVRITAITGGERKGNLDHLQKESKPQPAQPKRIAQVTAPIGLWDRYPTARTVQQMMDTMERIMEDPLSYNSAASLPRENGNSGYSRGRTPWDIIEGENGYKLRFDMPGMTKSDVKVWVEEKMLVVKGEKVVKRKEETEQGEADAEEVWPANRCGKYSCRIALPENVEYEKIKAEVKDGVLYITIPKASTKNQVLDINVQ